MPNVVAVRRSCRKGWYRHTDKGTLQLYNSTAIIDTTEVSVTTDTRTHSVATKRVWPTLRRRPKEGLYGGLQSDVDGGPL